MVAGVKFSLALLGILRDTHHICVVRSGKVREKCVEMSGRVREFKSSRLVATLLLAISVQTDCFSVYVVILMCTILFKSFLALHVKINHWVSLNGPHSKSVTSQPQ